MKSTQNDQKNLCKEILQVVLNSPVVDESDYDPRFMRSIKSEISHWVKENDVNDVKFTVSKEEVDEYSGDYKSILDTTSRKVDFVENYGDLQDKMERAFSNDYYGSGWDGFARSDSRWNEKYFFTGSDCTFYVLVEKIS